jgi:hypothetical protein
MSWLNSERDSARLPPLHHLPRAPPTSTPAALTSYNPRHRTGQPYPPIFSPLLPRLLPRPLVIDELHNVLDGRNGSRREFLNLLRFLGLPPQIFLADQGCPTYLKWTLKNATTGATPGQRLLLRGQQGNRQPSRRLVRAGMDRDQQCLGAVFLSADACRSRWLHPVDHQ